MREYGLDEIPIEERFKWLQTVVDSVYNGIIAVDEEGRIKIFNKASENILGFKRENVLGKFINDIIPNTQLINTFKKERIDAGKTLEVNGKVVCVNRTPIIFKGRVVGAIAVFQDITEIKKLKQNIKEMEDNMEILESVINSAYDGIIIVDENGYITKFNRAYENFLGIKEKDILGKHVTDVIENTRMHIVVKTGKEEIGHVQRIQGHDMIASRIPIKRNGKIIGAVGKVLFQDIQELKALAQRLRVLESKLNHYKGEIIRMQEAKYSFDNIITQNKQMERLKEIARRAAESNSTVLIQGESGTGKELFAHAIHKASYRKYGAFIQVNCAAIPKDLLEAELFGYEAGAFTGAKKEGKPGKFELANGGTILLDEIGSMPLEMQAKLLRVLEERECERIGGTEKIDLDIRVIASTNENLEEAVQKGKFREDLYYRLNVISLHIPPLRERLDDIPILAPAILKDLVNKLKTEPKVLAPKTVELLKEHNWPGNVRELRNVLERALNLAPDKIILPEHLPVNISDKNKKTSKKFCKLKDIVAKAEIEAIKEALSYTGGNRSDAARLLGIHRTSFYKKIERYGIDISEQR
ncbi:MAG: hypothetical protein PWQ82_1205 [Thermosediminibacterales bacterium]|nr:hypothetical protein [Thermosediminibacterales bacterium]MDK2836212.1 hypothetical protein [Thermosediminibacterales bacterium]